MAIRVSVRRKAVQTMDPPCGPEEPAEPTRPLYTKADKQRCMQNLLSMGYTTECILTKLRRHNPVSCVHCNSTRVLQYNGMLICRALKLISSNREPCSTIEMQNQRCIAAAIPRSVFDMLLREILAALSSPVHCGPVKTRLHQAIEILCAVRTQSMGTVSGCTTRHLFDDLCIVFDVDVLFK